MITSPEVNIGIVCANAPVLRPLYLFFRGRLATQQRSSNAGGISKQNMWPHNGTPRAAMSPTWRGESNDTIVGDGTVSMEMGLRHPHDDGIIPHENMILPQSPLVEKPYFIMGAGH